MSTCERSQQPLLTAELDELEGTADTDLGRHVRGCPHCSAAARKILRANDVLNATLADSRALNVAALVTRARSPGRPMASARQKRLPAIPSGWPWAAAAAGVVVVWTVLVIVGLRTGPPANPAPIAEIASQEVKPPLVDAPGYDVAIIPTSNPEITIIWLTKENDDGQQVDAVRDGPIAVGPANGL